MGLMAFASNICGLRPCCSASDRRSCRTCGLHFPDLRPQMLLAKAISHVAHTIHIQTPQQFFCFKPTVCVCRFAFVAERNCSRIHELACTTRRTCTTRILLGRILTWWF